MEKLIEQTFPDISLQHVGLVHEIAPTGRRAKYKKNDFKWMAIEAHDEARTDSNGSAA
jgi:hypothetical protein